MANLANQAMRSSIEATLDDYARRDASAQTQIEHILNPSRNSVATFAQGRRPNIVFDPAFQPQPFLQPRFNRHVTPVKIRGEQSNSTLGVNFSWDTQTNATDTRRLNPCSSNGSANGARDGLQSLLNATGVCGKLDATEDLSSCIDNPCGDFSPTNINANPQFGFLLPGCLHRHHPIFIHRHLPSCFAIRRALLSCSENRQGYAVVAKNNHIQSLNDQTQNKM
jgi:hypothetical protein